jgi:hypothetical protein
MQRVMVHGTGVDNPLRDCRRFRPSLRLFVLPLYWLIIFRQYRENVVLMIASKHQA